MSMFPQLEINKCYVKKTGYIGENSFTFLVTSKTVHSEYITSYHVVNENTHKGHENYTCDCGGYMWETYDFGQGMCNGGLYKDHSLIRELTDEELDIFISKLKDPHNKKLALMGKII